MKPINQMKVVFPSRSANEAFARSAAAAFVAQLDPTVDELADLRTAVSEAVTNCIVHAYADCIGDITLSVLLYEGGRVVIKIRDKGCGIADIPQAMEPLFTTGGEERSGLGFSVMESFTDRLKVASHPGRGTCVTMEKRLACKAGNSGEEGAPPAFSREERAKQP
ncbi:MAG: anti-sigma F factor [Clostridiales bacterium]|nr:anti-sigma F factor [Clostridiales bacterium]